MTVVRLVCTICYLWLWHLCKSEGIWSGPGCGSIKGSRSGELVAAETGGIVMCKWQMPGSTLTGVAECVVLPTASCTTPSSHLANPATWVVP